MKLGCIDYLNCYPFYYHMLEREPLKGVELCPRVPSELNRLLASGALDLSPVSAAAYADLGGDYALLPDFCISSTGRVGSVVLISRKPAWQLGGRPLGLTSASRTSVVLLKMILKKFYRCEPDYRPAGPRPGLDEFDAALLIGDDALTAEADAAPYRYDLGELWLEKTGRSVVFAVFAGSKAAARRHYPAFMSVAASYRSSLGWLKGENEAVVAAAHRKYPGVNCDVASYLATLRYDFTDELKEALQYYFTSAAELGLLKEVKALEFLKL